MKVVREHLLMVFRKADCLSTKHMCLALPKVQGSNKIIS